MSPGNLRARRAVLGAWLLAVGLVAGGCVSGDGYLYPQGRLTAEAEQFGVEPGGEEAVFWFQERTISPLPHTGGEFAFTASAGRRNLQAGDRIVLARESAWVSTIWASRVVAFGVEGEITIESIDADRVRAYVHLHRAGLPVDSFPDGEFSWSRDVEFSVERSDGASAGFWAWLP